MHLFYSLHAENTQQVLKVAIVNLTYNMELLLPLFFFLLAQQYHLYTWPHIFSIMKCSILSNIFQDNYMEPEQYCHLLHTRTQVVFLLPIKV